ncbi:MAG: hypothetical protein U1A77_13145 [Pirellulales bacterium]
MGKSGLSLARWSGWFFWVLLGIVQLARSGDPIPMPVATPTAKPADQPHRADRTKPADPAPNAQTPQDAMLEDIVRLRRALGGPLIEDPAGDRAFAEALRDLTRPPMSAPRLPPLTNTAPNERLNVEETPRLPLLEQSPNSDEVVVPAPAMLAHSPLADVLSSLRNTSRELDMRAHDLDELRSHEDADRVRRIAKRLRRDVRQLELDAEASLR